jgi:phosphoglycerate kinase
MGRPKGKVLEDKRLTPIVPLLSEAIKAPVKLAPDCIGPEAEKVVNAAKPGEVVLLENVRFHAGETKDDPELAKKVGAPRYAGGRAGGRLKSGPFLLVGGSLRPMPTST